MTSPVLPLPVNEALRAMTRCVAQTSRMLARTRIHLPATNIDRRISFADGSAARVYRETVADVEAVVEPVTLIVGFKLRGVRGNRVAHRLFRLESVLNTLLFAGFRGFVSKLWLAHDNNNLYRGVYAWDGYDDARAYVRALWWPLMVVSDRSSIVYHIIRGVDRDSVLAKPGVVGDQGQWWRPR